MNTDKAVSRIATILLNGETDKQKLNRIEEVIKMAHKDISQ